MVLAMRREPNSAAASGPRHTPYGHPITPSSASRGLRHWRAGTAERGPAAQRQQAYVGGEAGAAPTYRREPQARPAWWIDRARQTRCPVPVVCDGPGPPLQAVPPDDRCRQTAARSGAARWWKGGAGRLPRPETQACHHTAPPNELPAPTAPKATPILSGPATGGGASWNDVGSVHATRR